MKHGKTIKKASLPILLLAFFVGWSAHAQEDKMKIKVTIGNQVFTATMEDNPTAQAFASLLPLTLDMRDLHGNEKFFDLPNKLPTKDKNPGRIQMGDLMIWSSRTVVLFYESFPTSYSYTKIGRVDDVSGLSAAVGSGNVKVTFELQ